MTKTTLLAAAAVALSAAAMAQTPAPRIRSTIDAVEGNTLVLHTRTGEVARVRLADDAKVMGVRRAALSDIQPGSFVGTATVPQPDGTAKALEVTVFPPSMRGAGEGSYAWDLGPDTTMTNGTVGEFRTAQGHQMVVRFNGQGSGEKTVTVPDDAPVVLLNPDASRALLVPGAHVIVVPTRAPDGTLTANRISVGEDGVVPPM